MDADSVLSLVFRAESIATEVGWNASGTQPSEHLRYCETNCV